MPDWAPYLYKFQASVSRNNLAIPTQIKWKVLILEKQHQLISDNDK